MRKHEDKPNLLRAVPIGAGIGFAVLFGLILLCAKLVETGTLDEAAMLAAVLLSVAVGVLAGSLTAVRLSNTQKHLLTGTLVGFSVFAVIFCVGLIVSYPEVKHAPAMAAVTMLCGPAGALPKLIGLRKRKGARRRKA